MSRIEYINDPNAPRPNSIVPAATAFVLNEQGNVLLIQRSDNDLWALPGGGQDFGETISTAAVRETSEEAGIDIEIIGLVGIYTDPNHLVKYSDGEVRQQFSICLRGRPIGGSLKTSDESTNVRWVDRGELESLSINPSMKLRIDHGYEDRGAPYLG